MLREYLKILRKENFDKYQDKINQENKIGLDLIIAANAILLVVNFIMALIMGGRLVHGLTLSFQIVYLVIVLILYFGFLRRRDVNYTKWIYLLEIPVILIAVLDAVYYDAAKTTFTFMIILLLYPLFILDKPSHLHVFIVCLSVFYAGIASVVEAPDVYRQDMIHLMDVMLMSIGSSIFFSIVRIRSLQYADHIEKLAEEDPLTGLYNRAGARKYIRPEEPGIFVYLDLDKFKGVNDTFGHEQGDHVLNETARALKLNFRKEDIIMRLGGDEFAVWSSGDWSYEETETRLSELLKSIHEMAMDGNEIMTASIGCAYAPHGCASLDELTRKADQAMYEAKREGKDGYRITVVS